MCSEDTRICVVKVRVYVSLTTHIRVPSLHIYVYPHYTYTCTLTTHIRVPSLHISEGTLICVVRVHVYV
jgi:hypothetical protein